MTAISEESFAVGQAHAQAEAASLQRTSKQPVVVSSSQVRQVEQRRPGGNRRRPPPVTSFVGHHTVSSGDGNGSRSSTDDNSSTDFVALDTLAASASLEMEQEEEDEEGEQQQQQQQLEEMRQLELLQQQQQPQHQQSYFGYFFYSLQQRLKKSLSRSPTTPYLLRWLVPILSLCTHVIFLYGQSAHMWRLHLSVHVDAYANATSYESRSVFKTIGIPTQNHVYASQENNVAEFSFMFSITELWAAVGMPGSKILPRLAAILLILFSGVWPHLKLLLLQGTWFNLLPGRVSSIPTRRTRLLHWLGTLGKWSLADVLAVCVMVGVLHLDWHVDPVAMKQGVTQNFQLLLTVARAAYGNAQDICSAGLAPLDCHDEHKNGWDDWGKCKACMTLVNSAFDHPDSAQRTFQSVMNGVDVSGDGLIYLRVQGMRGIYAFCLAVVMSIVVSLVVDIADVRSHRSTSHHQQRLDDDDETDQEEEEEEIIFHPNTNNYAMDENTRMVITSHSLGVNQTGEEANISSNLGAPLLLVPPPPRIYTDPARRSQNRRSGRRRLRLRAPPRAPPSIRANCCLQRMRYLCLLSSSGATLVIVLAAIWYNTIARRVTGAIPQVLEKVLGVAWNRPYSLYSLVQTTGAAGGFDYLLMATFGLFVVAGPVIRAFLCTLAALTNTTSATAKNSGSGKWLLATIEFVGAFCAWEVFAAAVFMVNLLMPAITTTIIMKPECAELDPESGSCLQVEFQLQDSFALLLVGGGTLLLFLANAKFGTRNLHHHGQHSRSASSESSSEAFGYSMVVQSESNGGGSMLEDNSDDSATLTSELL